MILIDLQSDFIDGAMPVPGTAEVLPAVARLATAFRTARRPIVHAIRLYRPDGSNVDTVRRAAIEAGVRVVAPGTAGVDLPAALTEGRTVPLDTDLLLDGRPQSLSDQEIVLYKSRWSAFHRTQLADWLAEHRVDSVIVAGCNLPNCPRATLFDAVSLDLRSAVVVDAVSQATPERLADLGLIGVGLLTVDEVEGGLRERG